MKRHCIPALFMTVMIIAAMASPVLGDDDALKQAAGALGDLERQLYKGGVPAPEAEALLRRFLSDIDTAMSKDPAVTEKAPQVPLQAPAGEAKVKILRRGKGKGASLIEGKAAFKQLHTVCEAVDRNGDSLWDKSFKPLEIQAPEAGVVVELTPQEFPDMDDRGRVVALYAPASKRLWVMYPLRWSERPPGQRVMAGDVLGHAGPGDGKRVRLHVHLFEVAMGNARVVHAPGKSTKNRLKND